MNNYRINDVVQPKEILSWLKNAEFVRYGKEKEIKALMQQIASEKKDSDNYMEIFKKIGKLRLENKNGRKKGIVIRIKQLLWKRIYSKNKAFRELYNHTKEGVKKAYEIINTQATEDDTKKIKKLIDATKHYKELLVDKNNQLKKILENNKEIIQQAEEELEASRIEIKKKQLREEKRLRRRKQPETISASNEELDANIFNDIDTFLNGKPTKYNIWQIENRLRDYANKQYLNTWLNIDFALSKCNISAYHNYRDSIAGVAKELNSLRDKLEQDLDPHKLFEEHKISLR